MVVINIGTEATLNMRAERVTSREKSEGRHVCGKLSKRLSSVHVSALVGLSKLSTGLAALLPEEDGTCKYVFVVFM